MSDQVTGSHCDTQTGSLVVKLQVTRDWTLIPLIICNLTKTTTQSPSPNHTNNPITTHLITSSAQTHLFAIHHLTTTPHQITIEKPHPPLSSTYAIRSLSGKPHHLSPPPHHRAATSDHTPQACGFTTHQSNEENCRPGNKQEG